MPQLLPGVVDVQVAEREVAECSGDVGDVELVQLYEAPRSPTVSGSRPSGCRW